MLRTDSPFPFAGSFALYRDPTFPVGDARPELARIRELYPDSRTALISLPLRLGPSGNRTVPVAELLDGTPITAAEERELADLQRMLKGKSRRRKAALRRVDELRSRAMWAICLRSELAKWRASVGEDGRAHQDSRAPKDPAPDQSLRRVA